jgi:hypothetical protein
VPVSRDLEHLLSAQRLSEWMFRRLLDLFILRIENFLLEIKVLLCQPIERRVSMAFEAFCQFRLSTFRAFPRPSLSGPLSERWSLPRQDLTVAPLEEWSNTARRAGAPGLGRRTLTRDIFLNSLLRSTSTEDPGYWNLLYTSRVNK